MRRCVFQGSNRGTSSVPLGGRIWAAVALTILSACSGGGGTSTSQVPAQPQLASGQVDISYGENGRIVFARQEDLTDVAFDSAGNAYAVGSTGAAKLDASGHRIDAYRGDPAARPTLYNYSPVVDGSGNVYQVGNDSVFKRDPQGHFVTDFGVGGVAKVGLPGRLNVASFLVRDGEGNVYMVGWSYEQPTPSTGYTLIEKLDSNGRRVAAYDSAGVKLLGFDAVYTYPTDAKVDSKGNLVLGGIFWNAGQPTWFVMKFDRNGQALADFGQQGRWQSEAGCALSSNGMRIALDAGDNIYVAAVCSHSTPFVLKLDERGHPSREFGIAGTALAFAASVNSVYLSALMVTRDGTAYVAAIDRIGSSCKPNRILMAKLDSTGVPAMSFPANALDAFALTSVDRLSEGPGGTLYVAGLAASDCPLSQATFPITRSLVIGRIGG